MKELLIISPYFPPANAADMQRVRMSLPYYADYGWNAEIVMVDQNYTDIAQDSLLLKSIPPQVKIHTVRALKKSLTSKLGLGSLALRSLWFYKQTVNNLLRAKKYDLIYFSTTQFPVCILGAYWKKRFCVPYVIDMQDPWFSDYYEDKPKSERPRKYWFSYNLNKYLEPLAIKNVDGLISVSDNYIYDLETRYPSISNVPAATITFGAFEQDFEIANRNAPNFKPLLSYNTKNIVYIGRGGADMEEAITPLFKVLKAALTQNDKSFESLRFYFIGTSYAPSGMGIPTILPLAREFGVESWVTEVTDRISYYQTLLTLQQADGLFIPGSNDAKYTASKIFPYLLSKKPLLAIFNKASSALKILREHGVTAAYDYETVKMENISSFLSSIIHEEAVPPQYNQQALDKYSARQMAGKQCGLFERVLTPTTMASK